MPPDPHDGERSADLGPEDERILVLLPTSKDRERMRGVLGAQGIAGVPCQDVEQLAQEAARGAGAAILAEESLGRGALDALGAALAAQPAWSMLPLVVLTEPDGSSAESQVAALATSVVFVDRPVRVRTLLSVVRGALRLRRQQYAIRDALEEHRRQQDSIRVAEERLRLTIESARDYAIFTTDRAGRVTTWNSGAERVFGWPERDIVGQSAAVLFTEEDRAAGAPELEVSRALQHGRTEDERWHVRRDGSRFFADGTVSVLTDPDGHVLGFTRVARDATERMLAAQARAEAERRKDEFLATLAHELRNPLAPIRLGLEILRTGEPGAPAIPRAIEMMDRQLGHMVRLVDDLLDLSRISRGMIELRCERVSLRRAAEAAVEISRPALDAAGHTLTMDVPDRDLWVDGDLTRLAQIVANLLTNAARYTPPGGRIVLSLRQQQDGALLEVSDDGIGIAADMLESIFDMFTQAHRSLDRSRGGLGIGLALVRHLAELHGGSVTATSPGLGAGSTFRLRLPLVPAPTESPAPVVAPPTVARGQRVLVVDDNLDAADTLAMLLELEGCTTRTAATGEAAIEVAKVFQPDIAFLDIGLPGIDGYEVARRLRADPVLRGVLLVALTGWGGPADKARSGDAGFAMHITKPVDARTIAQVLSRGAPG